MSKRCSARTAKNRTCRNLAHATIYCQTHLKCLFNLYISKSTIDNAGSGLFTLIPLRKHDLVIEYSGQLQLYCPTSNYCVEIHTKYKTKYYIDAADSRIRRTPACYANDGNHNQPVSKVNCQIVTARVVQRHKYITKVFIQTLRNIRKHEEIFIDYGVNYWQSPKAIR